MEHDEAGAFAHGGEHLSVRNAGWVDPAGDQAAQWARDLHDGNVSPWDTDAASTSWATGRHGDTSPSITSAVNNSPRRADGFSSITGRYWLDDRSREWLGLADDAAGVTTAGVTTAGVTTAGVTTAGAGTAGAATTGAGTAGAAIGGAAIAGAGTTGTGTAGVTTAGAGTTGRPATYIDLSMGPRRLDPSWIPDPDAAPRRAL